MRQELFHHANRPAQIDFNLSSEIFQASGFVVNIDLTHDAGVVDQNVELRKLFGDLFVKSGDRFRIGNVASKGVNFWKGRFRTVHLSLIAAGDKNRVSKCRELFGESVTDAAGAAGDQNRIARELHNFTSLSRRPTASSIDFVDEAGLHPQNRAFVGLCYSPAFDRNYAGKERTKFSFGFLQDRRTHHIDPQSLGKFDGGGPSKTFQRARDGCSRGAGEDRFVVENARNQSEGSPFFDKRDRLLNQIDLTHELASQRKLPLFSGEFRKRSKCDFACCNGHGIKRTYGLLNLPDTFAFLDLCLEIACFSSSLD